MDNAPGFNFLVITGRSSGAGKATCTRGIEYFLWKNLEQHGIYLAADQEVQRQMFLRLCRLQDYATGIINIETLQRDPPVSEIQSLEQDIYNAVQKGKRKN